MRKIIISVTILLLVCFAVFGAISHNNKSAEQKLTSAVDTDSKGPQFSWDVVVDESSCDSHMCGTDLSLKYGDEKFRLGKFGGCDADTKYPNETYNKLLEYNQYSDLPAENEMVTYKNCPVMGGGYLFYVTDNGDGYRVMKKSYGDNDYTEGTVESEFLLNVKK